VETIIVKDFFGKKYEVVVTAKTEFLDVLPTAHYCEGFCCFVVLTQTNGQYLGTLFQGDELGKLISIQYDLSQNAG
jgi:hypothetical protein